MTIVVYGISHKTANLSIRERLSLSAEEISKALPALFKIKPEIKEALMFVTCQRTECYFYIDQPHLDLSNLTDPLLSKFSAWQEYAYTFYEEEALTYIMQVANGLHSSLLGEPQILGQIKAAYATAKNNGFLGKHLDQIMQFVFGTAKKIRHSTSIGKGTISLSYTALSLGKCIFSELANPYVLLIGAGTVIQNILDHLVKKKNLTIVIANRSMDKALKLADKYGATAIPISEAYQHIPFADVVISATSNPALVFTYHQIEDALAARKGGPLFLMDMAVPRDIAPEVSDLKSVFLYNIDDLHQVVQQHLDARHHAAREAQEIIETEVKVLMEKIQLNKLGSIIHTFRNQFEIIRKQLLERALSQLQQNLCLSTVTSELLSSIEKEILTSLGGSMFCKDNILRDVVLSKILHEINLGRAPYQVLSVASRSFLNQLIHEPTLRLKERKLVEKLLVLEKTSLREPELLSGI